MWLTPNQWAEALAWTLLPLMCCKSFKQSPPQRVGEAVRSTDHIRMLRYIRPRHLCPSYIPLKSFFQPQQYNLNIKSHFIIILQHTLTGRCHQNQEPAALRTQIIIVYMISGFFFSPESIQFEAQVSYFSPNQIPCNKHTLYMLD